METLWAQRFWAKVDKSPDGCWHWQASTVKGYGVFWVEGKLLYAHRVAYLLCIGTLPDGIELDHLCRNQDCVNPNHLEPVTHQENCRRGNGGQAEAIRHRAMRKCKYGHPFDLFNTYVDNTGNRHCRLCRQSAKRRYRQRHKAGQPLPPGVKITQGKHILVK